MYLHHLSLQAIGPFADRVDIDFATLGASGVFLLEGPTGAGKSTIIDAVVFALYGGLAGQDASRDRLHSQHADPTAEPWVELVFETGAGVHRVRRTPAYDRPKQRGSGTTKQNQSARLWRLASPEDIVGVPVSDRAQEVGLEVTRIVGLDRAQFVQTVVLPQGEFARFLQSPGEERRELLQSLFGTEIYERTTEELVAARRAVAASVERADALVRDAVNRFAEAAGASDVDPSSAAVLAEHLAEVGRAAVRARTARAAAADTARAAVERAERRTAALARRRTFIERDDALTRATADVLAARERLQEGDRAARVVPVLDGLDAAVARRAARQESYRRSCDAQGAVLARAGVGSFVLAGGVAGGGDATDLPEVGVGVIDERLTELRDAVVGSAHLVDIEAAAPARVARIAALAEGLAASRTRLTAVRDAVEIRPAERLVLVQAQRDAEHAAADREPAARALADATALAERVVARDAAAGALDAATDRLTTASAAALDAVEHESVLRARRVAGLAGELASALTDGAPCPVCGAVEHPHPASVTVDHPDAASIDAAADARVVAEATQQAAALAHGLAQAEHARLVTACGDVADADVLAAMEAASARIDAADRAARAVTAAERAVRQFDRDTHDLDREHTELTARLAADESAHDAAVAADEHDLVAVAERVRVLRAIHAGDDVDRDAARGADDDDRPDVGGSPLAAMVAAIAADADGLAAVVAAAHALTAASADVDARRAEADDAVGRSGFPDADAVRRSVLAPAEVAAARALVAAHDTERAIVDAALAEPDVVAAAADDDETIGLAAARDAATVATTELDAATGVAATAIARAEATAARRADLDRAVSERDAASAEGRAIVRLADVATGQPGVNPSRITLSTFVLMRRFEDVVAAANSRLGAMVGGRYALEASVEKETSSRAMKTGLALAVRDHETGRTRDPRSLSGGETFYASLCLALGLADVVQAEAGGVELGTLFVDEGFGTLDPETLDGVLGQLTNLTVGGRQVGIVSHVEELKQRIADRIEVRRLPSGGSTIRTTV